MIDTIIIKMQKYMQKYHSDKELCYSWTLEDNS